MKKILYLFVFVALLSGCSDKKRDHYSALYGEWTLTAKLDNATGQFETIEDKPRMYFYPNGGFAFHTPNSGYLGMTESVTGNFEVPEADNVILKFSGVSVDPTITVVRDGETVYFTFFRFNDGTYRVSRRALSN